jgi:hypothetical protein
MLIMWTLSLVSGFTCFSVFNIKLIIEINLCGDLCKIISVFYTKLKLNVFYFWNLKINLKILIVTNNHKIKYKWRKHHEQ